MGYYKGVRNGLLNGVRNGLLKWCQKWFIIMVSEMGYSNGIRIG